MQASQGRRHPIPERGAVPSLGILRTWHGDVEGATSSFVERLPVPSYSGQRPHCNNEYFVSRLFSRARSGMNNTDNVAATVHQRSLRIRQKSSEHHEPLLKAIDAIIFLQLGCLYLLDNNSFYLLIRAVSQVLHVQYRPPPLSPPAIQLPPTILINLICFATHLLQANPAANGWASRGYLHGGIIIDMTGELGPISKWRLALMDVLILGLQLVMLVVGHERAKALGVVEAQDPPESQDLEAAEEGRVRSRAQPAETEEGIELQSLLPNGSDEGESAQNKFVGTSSDENMIELDMRKGLKALLRRSRTVTATASVDNAADRAGIAELLSRIAAARARAA